MTATLYHRTSRVVSHGSPSTLLQETAQTLQSLGPVNRSPQYLIIENYRYLSRYQILFDIQCGNTAKPVNRFLKILTAYAQACIKVFLVLKVLILRITKLSLPIDAHSLYHFLVKPSFFFSFCTYSTYVDAQDHICPWNLAIHHRPVEAWPGRGT